MVESNYDVLFSERVGASAPKLILGDDSRCRFCCGQRPTATFSDIAHAVPECIGNKALLAKYECDSCNKRFSSFEDDFAKLTLLDRFASQVKGKKGVPSIKTKQKLSRMDLEAHGFVFKEIEGDPIFTLDPIGKTFTVEVPTQRYRPLGVFKALVKMAVAVMPDSEMTNFEEARQWLKESDLTTHQINDGTGYTCWQSFTPGPRPISEPHVVLFRRKAGVDVPYCIFMVAFGNTSFQIVVPSPKQDSHLAGKTITLRPVSVVAFLDPTAVKGMTKYRCQQLASPDLIETPISGTFSYEEITEGMS